MIEYTQFLDILYFVESFTQKRYFQRVIPLLNIVLIWTTYPLNLFGKAFDRGQTNFFQKPTFTKQYHNFNSHHPYDVKKELFIVYDIKQKPLVYQEEINSSRDNKYSESMTLCPRNLVWMIKNKTWKLTTVYLPDVKGLAEKIQEQHNFSKIN